MGCEQTAEKLVYVRQNRFHIVWMKIQFAQPRAIQNQTIFAYNKSSAGPCIISSLHVSIHAVDYGGKRKMQAAGAEHGMLSPFRKVPGGRDFDVLAFVACAPPLIRCVRLANIHE